MVHAHGQSVAEPAGEVSELEMRSYAMAAGAVRKELWGKILVLGKAEHESESYVADANEVRVHAHGTRKRGGNLREAIGRSSGGLTSNVILLTDALNFLCALS